MAKADECLTLAPTSPLVLRAITYNPSEAFQVDSEPVLAHKDDSRLTDGRRERWTATSYIVLSCFNLDAPVIPGPLECILPMKQI